MTSWCRGRLAVSVDELVLLVAPGQRGSNIMDADAVRAGTRNG